MAEESGAPLKIPPLRGAGGCSSFADIQKKKLPGHNSFNINLRLFIICFFLRKIFSSGIEL